MSDCRYLRILGWGLAADLAHANVADALFAERQRLLDRTDHDDLGCSVDRTGILTKTNVSERELKLH